MAKGSKGFEKAFEGLPTLIQIILLFIPGVNWVTEVLVRWSHALRKKTILGYIMAVVVTFLGLVFGWVDIVWTLLFKHLLLRD